MTVVTPTTSGPLLLLAAGDGPWAWRSTRYELLDGALDEATTLHSRSTISKLKSLGVAMRTQAEDGSLLSFSFGSEPPLDVRLGVTHEQAGVGSQMWDSAIALCLFQRSRLVPLPAAAKVVELGAGLGLPSLDLARWSGEHTVESVVLTDARPALVELAEANAAALRNSQQTSAEISVKLLEWGDHKPDTPSDAPLVSATVHADGAPPASDVPPSDRHPSDEIDVLLGSDICYEESAVPPLAALVERLRVPLALIIGPSARPSMRKLRERLRSSSSVHVHERRLSLVCSNADDANSSAATDDSLVRSAGVFSLLLVSSDARDGTGRHAYDAYA